MAESVFGDKSSSPTDADLDVALGDVAPLLARMEQHLREQYGEVVREWKFYGKQAGWTLALAHKGRRFCHLIPRTNLFTVVITLGERAVAACEASDLPEWVLSAIRSARVYAEGRSVRVDVTTPDDAVVVKELIAIKMSH